MVRAYSGRIIAAVTLTAAAFGLAAALGVFAPPDGSNLAVTSGADLESAKPVWFRDVTATSGVEFTFRTGREAQQLTILEVIGGGVALLDYDGDGLLDLFVAGGGYFDGPDKLRPRGHPCKLYRNQGAFQFRDVTKQTGLERPWGYAQGAAVADYDRDGWPDLLVTGYGQIVLLHNEADGAGGRRFVDVTAKLGLDDDSWSTSAGWGDLDGDGFPDLYVCHYLDWSPANHPPCEGQVPGINRDVCMPQQFKPLVHALFRNEGGRRFRNVSAQHGFQALGPGLGVVLIDVNDDQRPDVYVANDAANNFLFLNRGGVLEEKGLRAGAAVDDNGHYNASMGIDAADFEGTGRPGLWVTNYQGELHGLYRNLGNELFSHCSRSSGLGALGQHYVGFGTALVDIDHDGWEDLVIVNGHVMYHPPRGSPVKQRPVLLHNVGKDQSRMFQDVTGRGGGYFQTPAMGRGLAFGDLDNDGRIDLAVSHIDSPVAVLRNEAAPASTGWLGVRLVGRDHRDVIGTTVILEGSKRKLTRFAKGGGSYMSANDERIVFGLGGMERLERLTVKWSWGASQTWENLEPNSYWELHEGQAAAKRVGRGEQTR